MIVKFFKSNKQPIQKAFAYFLNGRVQQNTARLLWGNQELAEMLANGYSSLVKYFSGCLSFKEHPSHFFEQDKYEIMEDFMQVIMPSEEIRKRINWTWIEHTDKGRLELNFIVNTRFLEPIGQIKQYNFFCKRNFPTIDAFQDFIDARYDCESWKMAQPNIYKHHLKTQQGKTFNHEILQYMVESIIMDNPELETRNDLVLHLKKVGFNVSREVRGSISILPENSLKPIRLSISKDVSLSEYRHKLVCSMQNQPCYFDKSKKINELKEKLEECKHRIMIYEQKRYFKQSEKLMKQAKSVCLTQQKGVKPSSVQQYIGFKNRQDQHKVSLNSSKLQENRIKNCFCESYNPIITHERYKY